MRGRTIQPGDGVILLTGSANRDEAAFEHAGTFNIAGQGLRHTSFGTRRPPVHWCRACAHGSKSRLYRGAPHARHHRTRYGPAPLATGRARSSRHDRIVTFATRGLAQTGTLVESGDGIWSPPEASTSVHAARQGVRTTSGSTPARHPRRRSKEIATIRQCSTSPRSQPMKPRISNRQSRRSRPSRAAAPG